MITPRRQGTGSGFTLIELLVALALMGTLLAALLSFVFSMTEIWGQSGEKRLFDQHVSAVTQHLDALLRRAALPAAGEYHREVFSIRELRTPSYGTLTGLSFTLIEGDRLMRWGNSPAAPLVHCTLGLTSNRGLVLFWRSALEEDEEAVHESPVTVLITELTYNYYDETSGVWRSDSRPRRGTDNHWLVPEQLVLHFTYGELQADRTLTLPLAPGGLPLF